MLDDRIFFFNSFSIVFIHHKSVCLFIFFSSLQSNPLFRHFVWFINRWFNQLCEAFRIYEFYFLSTSNNPIFLNDQFLKWMSDDSIFHVYLELAIWLSLNQWFSCLIFITKIVNLCFICKIILQSFTSWFTW